MPIVLRRYSNALPSSSLCEYSNAFTSLRNSVRMRPSRNFRKEFRKMSRKSAGKCSALPIADSFREKIHSLIGGNGLRQQCAPTIFLQRTDEERTLAAKLH